MFASCHHPDLRPSPRCRRALLAAVITTFLIGMASAVLAQMTPTVPSPPAATPAAAESEVIPPTPAHYFNDYASLTAPKFADALNLRLGAFEHQTTDQFLVVIFPKMQSDAAINDYCRRVFNAWGVGQKGVNNGVVLFVFIQDHKLWLSVAEDWRPRSPTRSARRSSTRSPPPSSAGTSREVSPWALTPW